jgi:hypothetical protein
MKNSKKIANEMSAAIEALDALDLAFGNKFGTEGLEASEMIQKAMELVDKVAEVADAIPAEKVPETLRASFFMTSDNRVAAQHCWVIIASTSRGTYNHHNHFPDKAEAEDLLDRCRAAGEINLLHWRSCELQG